MTDPKSYLSSLFSDRKRCPDRATPANNPLYTFPLRTALRPEEYLRRLGDSPLLISGGTGEERSTLLADALSRVPAGIRRVVLRGGSEALARHRLDLLLDGVERGERLVLAVDGLTLRHPLLERPIPGVRLLCAAPDLSALPGGPEALPVQGCGVVLLRHTAYGSAERLSAHFFGTYERLVTEPGAGLRPEVRNIGMRVRRQRELRLSPRVLTMLPDGTACAALPDGWEGLLRPR